MYYLEKKLENWEEKIKNKWMGKLRIMGGEKKENGVIKRKKEDNKKRKKRKGKKEKKKKKERERKINLKFEFLIFLFKRKHSSNNNQVAYQPQTRYYILKGFKNGNRSKFSVLYNYKIKLFKKKLCGDLQSAEEYMSMKNNNTTRTKKNNQRIKNIKCAKLFFIK
ncbi:hypothetical protein RFI_39191 [Reticulomyxa filosa]|uniref:Uncharacterized protein n=1 Tax=Reticulomyxa filosa TaxID=46433 RepID=X6LC58_RETFI|nr:hypothetical protein RFI_39191 [Reticulomyxa filosa]|eukprot:ETN98319.1 hypothetical protein RFI_39191 [Reticulomyxa filosa]